MSKNIPKEHYLFEALREDPNVYVDDEKNDVKIGDIIIYIANNQEAFRIYIVVKNVDEVDENGNDTKKLENISLEYIKNGGKKKHKKTQHKRSRKQQIKTKTKMMSKMMKSKKYRQTKK
uniref:Uncharacterized protein n=1 Tax=viral metagenome TaxID=1070528 RepID=A0A6C0BUQ1_9ZZZZ